jgi:hypothetical protein
MKLRLMCLLALTLVPFTLSRAVQAQGGRSYTTNFSLTENPMSEGGNWINGQTVGLDWKNFRTTAGFAFGTQNGSGGPPYDDSTAILAGAWGPTQTVQATVRTVNQQTGGVYEEVELRLRTTITAHVNTGYEVNFRCAHDGSQYQEIVRFNGPINSYTYLSQHTGGRGLYDGDVIKATIIGNVITVYQNGTQINQATDSTYSSGSPGLGHWLRGPSGLIGDYGFTSFSASDGGAPPPAAPTNVRVITSGNFDSPRFNVFPLSPRHLFERLDPRPKS